MYYPEPWSSMSPYTEARGLVRALREADELVQVRVLIGVGEALGLPIVVLDPDDGELSTKVLLDALAELDLDDRMPEPPGSDGHSTDGTTWGRLNPSLEDRQASSDHRSPRPAAPSG